MYLYYDQNGVLKEIVNDEAIRQYDMGRFAFVYKEKWNADTQSIEEVAGKYVSGFNGVAHYVLNWFEQEGGRLVQKSTIDAVADDVGTDEDVVPFDRKRDLKFFKYGKHYQFKKIPLGDVIYSTSSLFDKSEDFALVIRDVTSSSSTTLGKCVFKVDDSGILPNCKVSVAQFEYLLSRMDEAIDSVAATIINADADASATPVEYDESADADVDVSFDTSQKAASFEFTFRIPKGQPGQDGAPGPQGPAGQDGVDGQDGVSATIEIGTVTTGEPGGDATVENVGTETNAVFNFTIPQGPTGAGVTFTPSVSNAGVISWTNDGDLPNPTSRNIAGRPVCTLINIKEVTSDPTISTWWYDFDPSDFSTNPNYPLSGERLFGVVKYNNEEYFITGYAGYQATDPTKVRFYKTSASKISGETGPQGPAGVSKDALVCMEEINDSTQPTINKYYLDISVSKFSRTPYTGDAVVVLISYLDDTYISAALVTGVSQGLCNIKTTMVPKKISASGGGTTLNKYAYVANLNVGANLARLYNILSGSKGRVEGSIEMDYGDGNYEFAASDFMCDVQFDANRMRLFGTAIDANMFIQAYHRIYVDSSGIVGVPYSNVAMYDANTNTWSHGPSTQSFEFLRCAITYHNDIEILS